MVEVGLKLIQESKLSFKQFSNVDEKGNTICLNCGEILFGSKKRYCSNGCYREFRENYIYHRYWVQLRKEVLEKFDFRCQKCKKRYPNVNVPYNERKLEVHHIIPKSEGGQDNFENFTVLCRKCHNQETTKQVRKLRRMKQLDKAQEKLEVFINKR